MATTLSGASIRFSLSATETTTVGASTRSMSIGGGAGGSYSLSVANGTSSSQGNCIASILGTLTGGSPVDLNLKTLTLAGVDDPLALTGIKGILVQDTSTNSGYLLVGDSSGTLTNALTAFWTTADGQSKIGAGGAWSHANPLGFTVDASHYILRLNATDTNSHVYQIDIIATK